VRGGGRLGDAEPGRDDQHVRPLRAGQARDLASSSRCDNDGLAYGGHDGTPAEAAPAGVWAMPGPGSRESARAGILDGGPPWPASEAASAWLRRVPGRVPRRFRAA